MEQAGDDYDSAAGDTHDQYAWQRCLRPVEAPADDSPEMTSSVSDMSLFREPYGDCGNQSQELCSMFPTDDYDFFMLASSSLNINSALAVHGEEQIHQTSWRSDIPEAVSMPVSSNVPTTTFQQEIGERINPFDTSGPDARYQDTTPSQSTSRDYQTFDASSCQRTQAGGNMVPGIREYHHQQSYDGMNFGPSDIDISSLAGGYTTSSSDNREFSFPQPKMACAPALEGFEDVATRKRKRLSEPWTYLRAVETQPVQTQDGNVFLPTSNDDLSSVWSESGYAHSQSTKSNLPLTSYTSHDQSGRHLSESFDTVRPPQSAKRLPSQDPSVPSNGSQSHRRRGAVPGSSRLV